MPDHTWQQLAFGTKERLDRIHRRQLATAVIAFCAGSAALMLGVSSLLVLALVGGPFWCVFAYYQYDYNYVLNIWQAPGRAGSLQDAYRAMSPRTRARLAEADRARAAAGSRL